MSKQKSSKTEDDLFIIGIDAEYVERDGRNFLISFQWCSLYRGKKHLGIKYPVGQRPKLATVLQQILIEAKTAGLFQNYPKSVYLVAHYTPAELHLLADFQYLKTQVDMVRGSFVTLTRPISVKITDRHRNQREVRVHLRDTKLLTPASGSLEVLGEIHGIAKVALPPGQIERMDQLLEEDQALFDQYALRDAEITAVHARWMAGQNRFLTGAVDVPPTLGGIAKRFCINEWNANGLDWHAFLGQKKKYKRGRRGRESKTEAHEQVAKWDYLARKAYHGGRSEAFWYGPTPEGELIDIDLVSAYPTAMATIGIPQWDEAVQITTVEQFEDNDLGFASVKFRFPEGTIHPCLPVRTEYDTLLFPLEGETVTTAIELQLAKDLGAEIEIIDGVRIPTDTTIRPFESVVSKCQMIRKATESSARPAQAKLYKELINSLYGKTAQGLKEKKVFDSRTGTRKQIPETELTQPFLAAHITGIVRSAMSSAIVRITQTGYRVYSVTTDGVITDAPEAVALQAFDNPTTQSLREARERLANTNQIIEVKHRTRQVVIVSHQGTFTSIPGKNDDVILARAGVSCPRYLGGKREQNAWLLDRFYQRQPKEKFVLERLANTSEIYKGTSDLVNIRNEVEINLEYDMKRRPGDGHEGQVSGHGAHIAFSTSPWQNVDEFMIAKERMRKWRAQGHVIRTHDDYDHWEDYQAVAALSKHGIRASAPGGCVTAALRQFLRAFTRGEWGLQQYSTSMTHQQLATKLQALGHQVSAQRVKNAGRPSAKLVDHVIPRTGKVIQFTQQLTEHFPGFDKESMLE